MRIGVGTGRDRKRAQAEGRGGAHHPSEDHRDLRPSDPPTPKSKKIPPLEKFFELQNFFVGALRIFGFEGRRVGGSEVSMFFSRDVGAVSEKT